MVDKMNFSKTELSIMNILWSSDTAMSAKEIAKRTKYRFAGGLRVSLIIEDLLEKDAIYCAGAFRVFSLKKEIVSDSFAPSISFAEYYKEQFKNIAPYNISQLLKKLLSTDRLSLQMLHEINDIVCERIKQFY